ncbi:MAG: hypothetical protein U9Q16_02420 [Patescibacteria group bacterium]|nr:hypothetical protein [Patescibacteria group bacterium]
MNKFLISIKGKGLDKKSLICFSIIIIEIILVVFGMFHLYQEIDKTNTALILEKQILQEIDVMDSLTAPDKGDPVPKEVMDSLTAPSDGEPVPQEVMDSLTAPEK